MKRPHLDTGKLPGMSRWRSLSLSRRSHILIIFFAIVAITWPFWRPGSSGIPLITQFPTIGTGVIMVVYAMMAVGLNIVVGYAGLLDLGYVAFYAVGAYTAGWLASEQFAGVNFHFWSTADKAVPGFHISIWLIVAMAGLFTALIGILIGLPTLRLRGDYLAIVTLGFGEILPQIARNGDSLGGFNLTNGPNGITPIDAPGFPGLSGVTGGLLPDNFLNVTNRDNVYYWAALCLLAVTVFVSLRLRDSRLGRAWIAIREDETAAAAMGVPLMRTKTWAYATGAFFGGVAGAYFASYKSSTFPGDFSFNISAFILAMVILGGMGNVWGVIFGAFFLAWLNFEGLANISASINNTFGTSIDGPKYSAGIFGLILVVTMLVRPEGLIPSARRKAEFHHGVHEEYLYDVEHGSRLYEEQGPDDE